jgi:hypothetical protein
VIASATSQRVRVLGAMDMGTMYQRGKIQEESLYYEHKKHDGSLPLVGVNTFLPKEHAGDIVTEIELIRSTEEEKGQQIENVRRYQQLRNSLALTASANAAVALPPSPSRGGQGRGWWCLRRHLPPANRPRPPERLRRPHGSREDPQPGADQSCVV